jgi:hypothetical protein
VFRRLQAVGLVINFEKCTCAVPEVDFLGHRVSASGFTPPSPAGWPPSRSTRGRGWSSSCWPS